MINGATELPKHQSKNQKRIKLCIVCDGGGHLREALLISEKLPYDKYFVTFYSPHLHETLKEYRYYTISQYYRNIFKFIPNFFQSLRIFLKERPDFLLSNGASVTVATLLIGKMFGKKLIFVPGAAQPFSKSLTGRFIYPFCDLFIVGWKPLVKFYQRAIYVGDFFK